MTHTIHRGPPEATAVTPVVFSHEAADMPVPRAATGEAHLMHFSANTTESPRQPSR